MGFTAGLRALGIAALAAVSILTVAAPSVAAAGPSTSTSTAAVRVVSIAEHQRGKRYVYGASGPSAFDCSGLVLYAYRRAGVARYLGGGHSAYAMLAWGRARHLVSGGAPKLGDVVIYGNGAHAAIYIGNGRVISALNPSQGIRITGLTALHLRLTGIIHTRLGQAAPGHRARPSARTKAPSAPKSLRTVRTRVFVNLRAGASTSTRVVVVLRPGVTIRVVGSTRSGGHVWDSVVYRGHRVWVRSDLVRSA